MEYVLFYISSRRRHTRCALVMEFKRVLFRSPPARADAAAAWRAAPARPLWPQSMPGSGFVSSRAPGGGSPVFIRNVARPELRIFYPARANGRSLLEIGLAAGRARVYQEV